MKNFIKISAFAFLIASFFAFHPAPKADLAGTYTVSENDPSQIQLVLNADNTFSYRDYSNAAEKIEVKGKWESKGRSIQLLSSTSTVSFHDKWKIDQEGNVAKSRKGMCFYTLRKL